MKFKTNNVTGKKPKILFWGGKNKMKEKDLKVLSFFRNNARTSLTKLSKQTRVPVSTIFDRLKDFESSKIISKHTSIVDFKLIGYNIRTQILLKVDKTNKEEVKKFLEKNQNINNVYRISNGYDFLIEGVFKNLDDLDVFARRLEDFKITDKKEFFVMEDIKREEFLCYGKTLNFLD